VRQRSAWRQPRVFEREIILWKFRREICSMAAEINEKTVDIV